MACGAPHGMEFSSTQAMTIRRIEGGILGNLTDMDATMTPFEAGLEPFVNMGKGDFIGRSALEGRDRRSLLHGLTCQEATPTSGSEILDDGGEVVGHITAGIPSPTLECGIGYARFVRPSDWVGRSMKLRLLDGKVFTADIVEVPFFDREKNIVRGVDRTIP